MREIEVAKQRRNSGMWRLVARAVGTRYELSVPVWQPRRQKIQIFVAASACTFCGERCWAEDRWLTIWITVCTSWVLDVRCKLYVAGRVKKVKWRGRGCCGTRKLGTRPLSCFPNFFSRIQVECWLRLSSRIGRATDSKPEDKWQGR